MGGAREIGETQWTRRGLACFGLALVFAFALTSTAPRTASASGPEDEGMFADLPPVRIRASTGFEYDRGSYGLRDGNDTEIWSVPIALRVEWWNLILGVSTSWLHVEGPPVDSNLPPSDSEIDSGIGDTTLSLSYVLEPELEILPVIEAGVQVKIPTADENEFLGTGKTDVTLRLDLAKRFGRITGFGTIGYRFVDGPFRADVRDSLGASSTFERDLDDLWLASLGASVRLFERLDLALFYDFRQSAFSDLGDAHELVVFSSFSAWRHLGFGPYAVVGLSENSPDYGLGLQLTVRR